MRRFLLGSAIAACGLLVASASAQADSVADFYKGKTVTVYAGYGAGGGYDAYARLLAGHIGKHLPGNPQTVVRNMPGAGSLKLMNYMATVSAKDGTEFGIVNAALALAPLIGDQKSRDAAKYDPAKMTWIGSLNTFVTIAISWHTSGIKTLEDTKKKEYIFGSTGGGLGPEMYANLVNQMLGTKWKSLRGYRGSRDISLAMERGEVPGFVGWCWECIKADKPHYISDKKVNVLLQMGIAPHPEMTKRNIPFIMDVLKDPKDKQVFKLAVSSLAYARPFVGPAGIPDDRKEALRKAFVATTKDPAFLAAAKKAKRNINVRTGAEIEELIKEAYALPKDVIERASKAATP